MCPLDKGECILANKFYGAISHIGGTDGDLDAITEVVLADGDGAFVLDAANNTIHVYTLVASSAAVEDAVNFTVIVPDDEAASPGKRWVQVAVSSYDATTQINHADIVDLTKIQTLTNKTLTSPVLNTGVSGTAVDTDGTLAANSDTLLASQKATKAYVDSQVTAQDLDFIGDAGGAQTVDLDSQTLSILGGTGLASTGSAQTMTLAIDSTVATLTGSQILTNKTLTLPQINDTSSDHQYIFAVSELAADRTVTLPLLAGNDEFVFKDFIQTMTNKTLTAPAITGATTIGTGATITTPIITTGLLAKAGETAVGITPDGAVELYYDNTKTFETKIDGIILTGVSQAALTMNNGNAAAGSRNWSILTNQLIFGDFALYAGASQGAAPSVKQLYINSAGAAELCYAGVKSFSTDSEGISVFDTSGNDPFIYFKDDAAAQVGVVAVVDGNMLLRDATDKVFVKLNAAGSAELYHNNVKKFETTATGILATGVDTSAGNEYTYQQGFNESAITSAANAVAWVCDTKQCALHTLTENTTISAPSTQQAGTTYQLRVVQAAGLYTLAWNAVFKWGAAITPVEPAADGDVVIFAFYSDGTNMYGTETNRTEA